MSIKEIDEIINKHIRIDYQKGQEESSSILDARGNESSEEEEEITDIDSFGLKIVSMRFLTKKNVMNRMWIVNQ